MYEGFVIVEQIVVQFTEIGDFCGPVVHLYIDISMYVAVPYSAVAIVPYAL